MFKTTTEATWNNKHDSKSHESTLINSGSLEHCVKEDSEAEF